MIENWEFCNLLGIFRRIGFKARLFNCREAAYLNNRLDKDAWKMRHAPVSLSVMWLIIIIQFWKQQIES